VIHLLSNAFVVPLLRGVGNFVKVLGYLPISNYLMGLKKAVSTLKNTLFVATNWVKKTCQAPFFGARHENGQNNGYRIEFCAGDFLYRFF
jgi:hypothetical protein